MIAMALINNPEVLIADEPTTALDVTTQAQILKLMERLQQEYEMAIVMITHDLGVVAELADDVLVMYGGRVVEQAEVDDSVREARDAVHLGPARPRCRGSTRRPSASSRSPASRPRCCGRRPGVRFHPRCEFAMASCRKELPELRQLR